MTAIIIKLVSKLFTYLKFWNDGHCQSPKIHKILLQISALSYKVLIIIMLGIQKIILQHYTYCQDLIIVKRLLHFL